MIRSDKMFSLGDVLGPKLAALEAKCSQLMTLADTVKAALPEPVRPHVLGVSRRGQTTLVVMVDSGVWTAHVRFAEEDIRRHLLEANEPDCQRVWVRVVAPATAAA